MSWTAVLVLAAGAYAFKAAGVLGLGRIITSDRGAALAALLPPALLAALVVVQTFDSGDGSLVVDARAAGVAVGAMAALRGASFVVVVTLAATVTAAIRLVL